MAAAARELLDGQAALCAEFPDSITEYHRRLALADPRIIAYSARRGASGGAAVVSRDILLGPSGCRSMGRPGDIVSLLTDRGVTKGVVLHKLVYRTPFPESWVVRVPSRLAMPGGRKPLQLHASCPPIHTDLVDVLLAEWPACTSALRVGASGHQDPGEFGF